MLHSLYYPTLWICTTQMGSWLSTTHYINNNQIYKQCTDLQIGMKCSWWSNSHKCCYCCSIQLGSLMSMLLFHFSKLLTHLLLCIEYKQSLSPPCKISKEMNIMCMFDPLSSRNIMVGINLYIYCCQCKEMQMMLPNTKYNYLIHSDMLSRMMHMHSR